MDAIGAFDWFESGKQEDLQNSLKSDEEIEKYSVDLEGISEKEKLKRFISGGLELQQLCAVNSLPTLIKHDITLLGFFAPLLKKYFSKLPCEVQSSAGDAFTKLIELDCLEVDDYEGPVLDVVTFVLGSKDCAVVEEWSGTLLSLIEKLPEESLVSKVCEIALKMSDLSQHAKVRLNGCRMFGPLAKKMSGKSVVNTFLERAITNCQDTITEVRATMSCQLPMIGESIGNELTQTRVYPELIELLRDEEVSVRTSAFQSLVEMISLLSAEEVKKTVIPIALEYARAPEKGPCVPGSPPLILHGDDGADLKRALAENYGKMVYNLQGHLQEEELDVLVRYFKALSSQAEDELRLFCAYNFPGMLQTLGSRKYALHLHDVFRSLCRDKYEAVRVLTAKFFHEVSIILGKERTAQYLRDSLLYLLGDSSDDVKEALLNNLHIILPQFSVAKEDTRVACYNELLQSVLALEKWAKGHWRRELVLVDRISTLIDHYSDAQLSEAVYPIPARFLSKAAANTVKKAAAVVFLYMMKRCRRYQTRMDLIQRTLRELARSKSFWSRSTVIDLVETAAFFFSRKFFKDHFLDHFLEALKDRVPNVRIKALEIVETVSFHLNAAEDKLHRERLDEALARLSMDGDKDVSSGAQNVKKGKEVSSDKKEWQRLFSQLVPDLPVLLERVQSEGGIEEDAARRADEDSVRRIFDVAAAATSVDHRRLDGRSGGEEKKTMDRRSVGATRSAVSGGRRAVGVSSTAGTGVRGGRGGSSSAFGSATSASASAGPKVRRAAAPATRSPVRARTSQPAPSSASSSSSSAAGAGRGRGVRQPRMKY
uniref:Serine/threonine-protein phosphatase 4 regulatory subunit 4 n=1 Tax=Palpitomonas bilix TaxID=652834 RepID=A0A7S3GCP8_9EUKA|mmetsp:Transcript_4364/g.8784  ORF Transcript_4364/g.8784 Transcript_4364/m.8784 type:complete len:825 (+) Transcript_4364:169-2643(+)